MKNVVPAWVEQIDPAKIAEARGLDLGCWGNRHLSFLYYVDGKMYYQEIELSYHWRDKMSSVISRSHWKKCQKLVPNPILINGNPEALLEEINPYGYEFQKESSFTPEEILIAPHIEQLTKAGYRFSANNIRRNMDKFNRLTRPGQNLKEIFKTSKSVYVLLKDETDLSLWDTARKMDKLCKISKEDLERMLEARFQPREMALIEDILKHKFEDKPTFTYTSLINFLDRIDMFQAIPKREGLQLLRDYLMLCKELNVKPNTDSDSLKREHDVAARILRSKRDDILNEKIASKKHELGKYNYYEEDFFIRGVESYDDILDEARQQHNCLASYGRSILNGNSIIYFMRETAHPERSLVTVEIRKIDGKYTISQKYMAYNQPIRNKAMTEFLERWERFINQNPFMGIAEGDPLWREQGGF
ncbi:MAG: PcfJ domain-containing protein [Lachnospiraceae bacterium]|nr:PcfJ domain-containing protein [Lachnospiraceae bacterium]